LPIEWELPSPGRRQEEHTIKTADGRIWRFHAYDRRTGKTVYRYDSHGERPVLALYQNPPGLFDETPPLEFPEHRSQSDLARSEREARAHVAGGRRPELLKEGRTFDSTRAEAGPLFRGKGRQQSMFDNPPAVQIYQPTRGLLIEGMQKPPGHPCDRKCRAAQHKYRHLFREPVEIIGLPDGSVLLRAKRR
jgi:hypothetical protein